ncbi:extradiol dioxygenase [Pedobacter changchengzhani]|uniref:Extradiol dioxygenase n=1 Tax=Pedobacter changchengzhani TaxID=2529274 RepID=A0A4R5MK96_9SPHI|nr:VOC family protein [Pedobacter changchengzhani]TDG36051.1 extradiol dioxygenase [Pedobacter changchengzhani]
MTKSIWINLPVKNLKNSIAFFTQLGFTLNLNYGSREDSACFLIGESNFVLMLFEEALFENFISSAIADTKIGNEVLVSIDAESAEEVDEMIKKVIDAGGTVYAEPGFNGDWMYGAGFIDLDGHKWNLLFMDLTKLPLG